MQVINVGSPASGGNAFNWPQNMWADNGAPSSGDFGINRTYRCAFVPQVNLLANRFSFYNSARSTTGNIKGAFFSSDGSQRLATFDHDWTFTYHEEMLLSADMDLRGGQMYWVEFNQSVTSGIAGRVNTSSGRVLGYDKFIENIKFAPFDDADSARFSFYESESSYSPSTALDLSEAKVSALNGSNSTPWMTFARKVT